MAGAQGDEPDAMVVELGQHGLGGELGVEDQQRRVMPGYLVPVVGECGDFPVLAGLRQVGVGVEQGVGVGVFGEEGQHRAGALGPAGHVAEPANPPPNTLGLHRVMFAVHDIHDTVARLRDRGAELLGEIAQYENIFLLCYLRGPAGIMVALAEQIG